MDETFGESNDKSLTDHFGANFEDVWRFIWNADDIAVVEEDATTPLAIAGVFISNEGGFLLLNIKLEDLLGIVRNAVDGVAIWSSYSTIPFVSTISQIIAD